MNPEEKNEFEELMRPVIKWLAENKNPHTTIIATSTYAELVEGVEAFATEEYLRD